MESIFVGQNIYIRPNYIVSLPEWQRGDGGYSFAFQNNFKNLANNSHNGEISRKADRNIKNAINWLLCAAEPKKVYRKKTNSWFNFKVNFITLTLPDTQKEIKEREFKGKILNTWLTKMRQKYGLKNYVWKIEFQKNGKLHVHLTTDTFIHYQVIRDSWNKILKYNGYMQEFAQKHGHTNPNSTDIHSVKKIRNLAAYIAKYMSKKETDKGKIFGRIWGCNYEISRVNKTSVHISPGELKEGLECLFQKNIEYKKIYTTDKYSGKIFERGEMFFLKYTDWLTGITGPIKEKFIESIQALKNLAHNGAFFSDLAVV